MHLLYITLTAFVVWFTEQNETEEHMENSLLQILKLINIIWKYAGNSIRRDLINLYSLLKQVSSYINLRFPMNPKWCLSHLPHL